MEMAGRVAFVTGANRGLGAAIVQGLLGCGAKVYAAARQPETLDEVVAKNNGRVVAVQLDVTDAASVHEAAVRAGDVEVLFNNAGVLGQRSLVEAGNLVAFREEMEVNVFGLAQMSLEFAPLIERNGGGAIVNILSVASLMPFAPFGTYAASKAAAMSLSHSMRWDFRERGVEIFGVYAGFIDTPMTGDLDVEKTPAEEIVARMLAGIEAGELDIATDERSRAVREQFHSGLDEFLQEIGERATGFRAAHPISKNYGA